jgi:hypothetical protein
MGAVAHHVEPFFCNASRNHMYLKLPCPLKTIDKSCALCHDVGMKPESVQFFSLAALQSSLYTSVSPFNIHFTLSRPFLKYTFILHATL